MNTFSIAQNRIENLFNIIRLNKQDTVVVKALTDLSDEYSFREPEKALYFAEKGLELSRKKGYLKGIALCYKSIGIANYIQGKHITALNYFQKALKISKLIGYEIGVAESYKNIGNIFFVRGQCPQAIIYYQKALQINEKYKNNKGIVGCYINIGSVHSAQFDYPQALKYFFNVLELCNGPDFLEYKATAYNNIGLVYFDQDSLSLSLEYYNKALVINKLLNNKYNESTNYLNISVVYAKQGYNNKALKYLKKAIEINELLNDEIGISSCYTHACLLNINIKNYNQAIEYGKKALNLSNKAGLINIKQTAYLYLSSVYDSLGNIKEAFRCYKLFLGIKDTLFNQETQKKIAELEVKYEAEKKEKEIHNKNLQISLLQQGKRIERLKRNVLFAGICIITIASVLILINLRKRLKLKNQLFEHQEKQFQTQKLLAESELKNEKMKSMQLQKELEYKNKELVNFALHIVEKNEFLENFKNDLLKSDNDIKPDELIKTINHNIISLEKERIEFENNIEQVSESFFLKLREKFPNISKNEERLSALLKLNLSSKEIAMVLNRSPKSIGIFRHRLRKKLGLNEEDNLHDFLNSL